MSNERIAEIYDKIVYTKHIFEDVKVQEERKHISKWLVAKIIALGFKRYGGNQATKSIWRGHEVVYKVDTNGCYVIITFYPRTKNKVV